MVEDSKLECRDLKLDCQEELEEISKKYPRGIYVHHKGGLYCLYSMTVHESLLLPLFHYYSLQKKVRWTRDFVAWTSIVQRDDQEIPRFKFLRDATRQELLEACGLELP